MALPWIPLLTLGSQLLGGFLGNQTSETTQQNSTTTGVTGQTSSLQSGTTQSQTSSGTSTGSETGAGTVTRLDDATKSQLTDAVRGLLSDAGKGSTALQAELDRLSGTSSTFDPDAFVSGLMQSATARTNADLESGIGALGSRAGVNSGSNSAVALLESRLKSDAVANLAGIESNARGQAEQIRSANEANRAGAITSLAGGASAELSNLLSSLLQAGEQQTTTATSTGTESSTSTAKEDTKQTQNQAGTTQQTTVATGTGKTQENDWASLLGNLGKVFSTTF